MESLSEGYLVTFQLGRALSCLDLWLQRRPNDVQALSWRAEISARQQDFVQAEKDYRRVTELDSRHIDARLHLAQLLFDRKKEDLALGQFKLLLEQQPDNPAALLGVVRCYRGLEKPGDAREVLDRLLEVAPENVEAWTERGRWELINEHREEAEKWLRKAYAKSPQEREIVFSLGRCLQLLGKQQEADELAARLKFLEEKLDQVRDLTQKIAEKPTDPGLRHAVGLIFMATGQNLEGMRWMESALVQEPGYKPAHASLAEYYEKNGNALKAALHRQLSK